MAEQTVEKVIRDGKVAVLVSKGYGAGWYSWHGVEAMLFDPVIVGMVEAKRNSNNNDFMATYDDIEEYAKKKYDEYHYYGIDDLTVEWVPVGAKFRIHEYDGSETLILESDEVWITA